MIYIVKKYWKIISIVISLIFILIGGYIYYKTDNYQAVDNEILITKEAEVEEKESNEMVFVDIKGAVVTPGVYKLNENSRIIDVINLAGGLLDNAYTVNLNLSKKIIDEMYIIVYTKEEIESYKQNNKQEEIKCVSTECICPTVTNDACAYDNNVINGENINEKININSANKEELMKLTGIGEVKAKNIIDYREKNGKFNSIEQIKNVSGISEAVFQKIKEYITI